MRNKNNKKHALVILLLLVVGISIGYAALTTTLNINGTTTIEKATWDVHFENLTKTEGSQTATVEAAIDTTKTLIEYTVTLLEPGDFYEFKVDIVNDGTIDAMISEVLKEGLTTEQQKYIEYTVVYEDDAALQEKDSLKAKTSETIKIRVKYKDDITAADLPTTEQSLVLKFQVTYIQDDGTSKKPGIITGCLVTKGDGNNTGDEITCGTEDFYVVSSTTTEITMLAKYNLNVGNNVYTDGIVGIQNENVQGYVPNKATYGTLSFSNSTYWLDSNNNLLETYGTNYPAFVYNKNSNLYQYINDYATYLKETVKVSDAKVSLLSYDDITGLKCSVETVTCTSAPSWVYSTSYWIGVAHSASGILIVDSNGDFGIRANTYEGTYGVRPKVIIPKDIL